MWLSEETKTAQGLRDRIVLTTKGGIIPGIPYASRADHLIRAAKASLARLGKDVIDLYQVHRPDLLAQPAEVATALDRLQQDGKIKAADISAVQADLCPAGTLPARGRRLVRRGAGPDHETQPDGAGDAGAAGDLAMGSHSG